MANFLRNHAPDIAASICSLCSNYRFRPALSFVIVRLTADGLVWINVTAKSTAEWVARQITRPFLGMKLRHYLIRDRDQIYGKALSRADCAPWASGTSLTAPASPSQNGFAERLIGSIRRDVWNHVVIGARRILRRILKSYAGYYNEIRLIGH